MIMTIKITNKDLMENTNPMVYLDKAIFGEDSEEVRAHLRLGFAIACSEKRVDLTRPHRIIDKNNKTGNYAEITQEARYLFPKKAS